MSQRYISAVVETDGTIATTMAFDDSAFIDRQIADDLSYYDVKTAFVIDMTTGEVVKQVEKDKQL